MADKKRPYQATVTISRDLWEWLQIYAIKERTSGSAIIRKLVADFKKEKVPHESR